MIGTPKFIQLVVTVLEDGRHQLYALDERGYVWVHGPTAATWELCAPLPPLAYPIPGERA